MTADTGGMGAARGFPIIKTARELVVEGVLPCSEDYVRELAKQHGVGRKLGRTFVFTPADVERLIESLPCPSKSPSDTDRPTSTSAGLSEASAWTKALAQATRKPLKTSASRGSRSSSKGQSTVTQLRARSQTLP